MHSELVRDRMRTTKIVARLERFVLGEKDPANDKFEDMSPHQVTAALGLLKKTIPDLQAIEHLGEIEHRHHVVNARPLTEEEWALKYGQHQLEPPLLDG